MCFTYLSVKFTYVRECEVVVEEHFMDSGYRHTIYEFHIRISHGGSKFKTRTPSFRLRIRQSPN